MKCSFCISNVLEISSLSPSVVFLYFFALLIEEGLLVPPAVLWNSAFSWVYLSLSTLLSVAFLSLCCMLSHLSRIQLFATLWTAACQASFVPGDSPGKHTGVGCQCPPPGDLPNPGIKPVSLTSNLHWQAGSLPLVPPGQLFVKPPQTTTLPYCISFSFRWFCSLSCIQYYEPLSIP